MTRGRPKGKANRPPSSDWARALKARLLPPKQEAKIVTDKIVSMRTAGSSWADVVRTVGVSEPTARKRLQDRLLFVAPEEKARLLGDPPAPTPPEPEPEPEPAAPVAEPAPTPGATAGFVLPPVHSGPAEVRPEPELIDLSDTDLSTPEGVTQMMLASLQQLQLLQQRASEDGNHTAAQRALRDIVALTNTLTRHQKEAASGQEGLHITAEEAAATEKALEKRFEIYAKQKLLCAECGRAMRIALSKPKEEDE